MTKDIPTVGGVRTQRSSFLCKDQSLYPLSQNHLKCVFTLKIKDVKHKKSYDAPLFFFFSPFLLFFILFVFKLLQDWIRYICSLLLLSSLLYVDSCQAFVFTLQVEIQLFQLIYLLHGGKKRQVTFMEAFFSVNFYISVTSLYSRCYLYHQNQGESGFMEQRIYILTFPCPFSVSLIYRERSLQSLKYFMTFAMFSEKV